jgi:RND family efflux transporter MFP subunit
MSRLVLGALLAAACSRAPASEPGPGAAPAVQAGVLTLSLRPLEDTSDYVAVLASRQSVLLYPQVPGQVRGVDVRPGAAVQAGQRLLELDGTADQATLDNLVATRASLATGLALAGERLARAQALRADGIVSQQALDEARAQADQARAALQATDASVASQRARLGFFRILAPLAGVVGEVLVKPGDFVTPATALTSVSRQGALEADVHVPAERAGQLSPQSRVRLLGSQGQVLAEQPVSFVAPRVDPATQLVLVKAVFESLPALRPDQAVRARVVWSRRDGLAIPTTAVLRQAGQAFAFVVERKDGLPVARRVPLGLGRLGEGEVEVTSGLDAGVQVVVSGIQQLTDGAAVDPRPPAP